METNEQTAKADAGKLQLSLVDTDAIKTIATLEKHDQDERSRLSMACNMAFICEMMGDASRRGK